MPSLGSELEVTRLVRDCAVGHAIGTNALIAASRSDTRCTCHLRGCPLAIEQGALGRSRRESERTGPNEWETRPLETEIEPATRTLRTTSKALPLERAILFVQG